MRSRTLAAVAALVVAITLALPGAADAQILKRLKDAAKDAAEGETTSQVDRLIRDAIRCLVDDPVCYEEAQASGQDVIFVDDEGEIITDDEGAPITDPEQARARNPVDEEGASGIPPEGTYWNLTFDGQVSEGTIGYVNQVEGQIVLHLVDRQAVNLHLIVSEDPDTPWEDVVADLVFGRGRQCAYPFDGADPFSVEIVTEDPEWVSGSYDGVVRCDDETDPVLLGGDFRVRRAP